jgi:hypothetical protein
VGLNVGRCCDLEQASSSEPAAPSTCARVTELPETSQNLKQVMGAKQRESKRAEQNDLAQKTLLSTAPNRCLRAPGSGANTQFLIIRYYVSPAGFVGSHLSGSPRAIREKHKLLGLSMSKSGFRQDDKVRLTPIPSADQARARVMDC